ncbi:probable spindle assembly checkpoint kinase homolog [Tetranychus urticae]|uniref:Protein kinase domain-containing protein n=1 Tax=Tetranychus urticae TaxID=32264 RepID=T1KUX4_TETUR|nr:probable spindle assembly checkpoint kinase homolog [Tetranychus urticae]
MAEEATEEAQVYPQERDVNEITARARKILSLEGAKSINDEDYLSNREGYKIFRETLIGKGKFSQFYAARTANGVDVTVKVLPLSSLPIKYKENLLRQGTKILSYFKTYPCDQISSIIDIYMTKIKVYVFCEPLGQDLEKISRKTSYKEEEFKPWIVDIMKGLQYLYENCIGHRNLQASNVVLSGDKATAKLTGFGNAIVTWDPDKQAPIYAEKEKEHHHHLAPETLKGEYDAHIADIWGIGCIISILLTRKPCFEKKTRDYLEGYKTHLRRNETAIGSDLECFLNRVFIAEPTNRAPLSELMAHHWIVGGESAHNH